MAEPTKVDKQDSLEDSLASDEWTIIYKRESKVNDLIQGKTNGKPKTSDKPKEAASSEEACSEKNVKSEIENVDKCEEVSEKGDESDVSVISAESELEHIALENRRIERIEWQVERKDSSQKALVSKTPGGGNITSNTLITCSVIALIIGIILAGRIVEFQGSEKNNIVNTIIEEKLQELAGIEEKLKELNDVKQALDQIQVNMPEIKKLKDQLSYQTNELRYPIEVERPNKKIEEKLKELAGIEEKLKELNEVKQALNEIRLSMSEMKQFEKTISKETNNDYKPFEKLNIQNILNSNTDSSRLEMLKIMYQNFCLTINNINASSSLIQNELCKTPKILSEMILFKENLRRAFEQSQNSASTEKRVFTDFDKKLDEVSESLLSELSPMFSRFSMKIQERLNRFGYKVKKRLCSLHYTGITDDKFLNILLDDKFFVNNCNDTTNSNHVTVNIKYNSTYNEEKHHSKSKRSYEELKKNGFKYDYKNMKNYKKFEDSREEHSHEKKHDEENTKSKGEIKNDNNWKKHKYEDKDKHYQEEKYEKYKHEKFDNNYKNECNKKNKQENDNFYESDKKEFSNDRKFENGKRERNYDRKYDHKKDHDRKYTYNKDDIFSERYEDKRNNDYDDDESKYIVNLEYDAGQYIKHDEEKIKYKNEKEYMMNSENYKESKYKKYENKKDKYQANGEWQMQRGKAREKLRNSDWYFVRADSRRKARTVEDSRRPSERCSRSLSHRNQGQQTEPLGPEPPRPEKAQCKPSFGRRVWNLLNAKLSKYL